MAATGSAAFRGAVTGVVEELHSTAGYSELNANGQALATDWYHGMVGQVMPVQITSDLTQRHRRRHDVPCCCRMYLTWTSKQAAL